ncbi:MAG: hypothetical protein AUH29_14295 [Candidatus Rokubacteria bacterium 13_1_40CM_69_27]|nr:MAG: hypothetical protein AUH29_14295 [Candidatus Rokubacteria bacterium 13_1_40CM_69_27]OLC30606.1 MAG: hypothetical protein AUH81_19610 [Candidatus Rokubacteria bacterium 13_1_40CM_4_69_5]OLE39430.1 MAG: hypothetical protein AUG00_02160 [Candidatus Rokubacteria bacterium 13_1_20CM_2_70_7]
MTQSLTERLQQTRLTIVDVDVAKGRLRVRGAADACTELSCSEQTVVLSDEGKSGLEALNPGDIVKIEPAGDRPDKIVVVRRAWEEIASPEI